MQYGHLIGWFIALLLFKLVIYWNELGNTMSFNLCLLPREEKYQIQLDYEASFWAYQIKRNKKTREQVYNTIHSRPVAEQMFLKQQFEQYLSMMLS